MVMIETICSVLVEYIMHRSALGGDACNHLFGFLLCSGYSLFFGFNFLSRFICTLYFAGFFYLYFIYKNFSIFEF